MNAEATTRDGVAIGSRMSVIWRMVEAPTFRAASRKLSSTDRYAPSTSSTASARFFHTRDTAMPAQVKAMDGGSPRSIRPNWARVELSVPRGASRTRIPCPTTTKGTNSGILNRNSTGRWPTIRR